eukprot:TRINITY_DN147_c0_g2_i1.p1 TRINITY_DN147_c0_g2~~TRINITY_DN147_c0_g2_i1.p1  ORF type:complete len:292 (-),score=70.34 TRINITY_DN147_c0_g2_i1:19-834(-)
MSKIFSKAFKKKDKKEKKKCKIKKPNPLYQDIQPIRKCKVKKPSIDSLDKESDFEIQPIRKCKVKKPSIDSLDKEPDFDLCIAEPYYCRMESSYPFSDSHSFDSLDEPLLKRLDFGGIHVESEDGEKKDEVPEVPEVPNLMAPPCRFKAEPCEMIPPPPPIAETCFQPPCGLKAEQPPPPISFPQPIACGLKAPPPAPSLYQTVACGLKAVAPPLDTEAYTFSQSISESSIIENSTFNDIVCEICEEDERKSETSTEYIPPAGSDFYKLNQ